MACFLGWRHGDYFSVIFYRVCDDLCRIRNACSVWEASKTASKCAPGEATYRVLLVK